MTLYKTYALTFYQPPKLPILCWVGR